MTDAPRIRLVVLFGGQSAEHEVSLVTARHVLAATDAGKYDIRPLAITKSGEWVQADDAARALAAGPESLPEALPTTGTEVEPQPALTPEHGERVVVFPLLHGPLGEDGTVQGLLELADVAYVGCGVLASAVAMDKARAKQLCAAVGLPQPAWRALHERDIDDALLDELIADLGLPLFVKPANMGSSVGVSRATSRDELAGALDAAARFDEWLVVEEAVEGREIEVAVMGNLDPRSALPGEVVPGADFYDYEDKYRDGRAKLMIPAPLSSEQVAEVQALAVRAFQAIGCEGMARVDFFLEEGGRGFLLNEVNTIPGFTPISMYPKMWEASGVPYPQLIDELVALAIERHDRRSAKRRRD